MSDIDVEPVDEVEDAGDEPGGESGGDAGADGPTDVPVEVATDLGADADLPAGVDAPEYVLYGGKGGVGKTTMAAATALSSAAGGTPTLVVSTDPAHSLSDTLGVDVPARAAQIRDDLPLYAAEIDPDQAMDEGLFGADGQPLGGLGDIGDALGGAGGDGPAGDAEGMNALFGGPMPGADEAAAMRQLLEYLDDPRFERVVVDTAPTGHTLRLLQLPEVMDSMVGRMLRLRDRLGGMMDGITGMFGRGADDDAGEFDDLADLEALQDRIERLRTVLQDPDQTDFRVVMVPEEMSVVESERLVRRLGEFEIPVDTVVVNRVMEDLADVADLEDSKWVVTPNLETCEFCQRRWQVQQRALERAMELFRGRTVKRVPLLADEVRGEAALRVVAACLE